MTAAMKLEELLEGAGVIELSGDPGLMITGIAYDSRTARNGDLFAALPGGHADGRRFVAEAVGKGAAAVLYEGELPAQGVSGAALVKVRDSRLALAAVANNFHGRPSSRLAVSGITGTNGKTTTSYILKAILEAWGQKVGLIGTIQYLIGSEAHAATHTTPESPEFQKLLGRMLDAGCSHVVTEVSSHALAQRRVHGTVFRVAVFTNLTRDHLDFHTTMDDYFAAKKQLFTDLLASSGCAVVNHDDPYGRRLAAGLAGTVTTFGLEAGADLQAHDIRNSFEGLSFTIAARGRRFPVSSPLIGLPNVYNILSAAGAAAALGVPWDTILDGVRGAPMVAGRFERVDAGQKFLAVVDYAHTEDALERLIYTARGLTKGRIIVVFGCGGDRDRGKRPRMGAVATRLADLVIITSDNPRSEDPAAIIREIEAGAARKNYLVEEDRAEAIRRAVLMAGEGDVLLVAGKGHETYQEAAGRRTDFNDRKVLEDSMRQLINNR
ncbi:MAG: UDP-N-acetylmuramoyl-L-alanyl-D-glutamate--2,6-diaminopimelate ligase [Thermodesulfovibrionales bacterium]